MRCLMDEVALGRVSLRVLQFSLSLSFHQCYILIFIYMLLLQEGQTGDAWGLPESNALSEIGGHWIENYFCLVFKPIVFSGMAPDDCQTVIQCVDLHLVMSPRRDFKLGWTNSLTFTCKVTFTVV